MSKKNTMLLVLVILVLLAGAIYIWRMTGPPLNIYAATDKQEYDEGGVLKIAIQNNLPKNICFSSCYPYLLEKKDEDWKQYIYAACDKFNVNETCINSGKKKAFEINLSFVENGMHRLVLPVCLGCKIGEKFKTDKKFYSNEFSIK